MKRSENMIDTKEPRHIKKGVVIHRWCENKKDEIGMGLCDVT